MRVTRFFSLALGAVLIIAAMVAADVPNLINYQGRLTNQEGEPVADGTYALTLTVFDAASGGVPQWTETQGSVAVLDGLFTVIMGSQNPLPDTVFSGPERYLEVSVNGQTISPRTRFTSVGYSHRISTVDGAKGGQLQGALQVQPIQFDSTGNGLVILGTDSSPLVEVSVNALGQGTVSLYEPTDSKEGLATNVRSMDLTVDAAGVGKIIFYEPVDSYQALSGQSPRKVEMSRQGLVMFGENDIDTNLFVGTNGDIVGLGQITMGENSSDGVQTAVLGFDNDASGDSSAIGGGTFNTSAGVISVIGGGHQNATTGTGSMIGGGAQNTANGEYATISGGQANTAGGDYSIVPGGLDNFANGSGSFAAGRGSVADHAGAFVWADQNDAKSGYFFSSTAPNQFLIRARGGVGINTNDPTGALDVAGEPGDSSVNLPDNAISRREIIDEPGLASNLSGGLLSLPQGTTSMMDVVTTSITTPVDGYIIVRASATLKSSGTSGANQAVFQVDELAGGIAEAPYYQTVGGGDHDSPGSSHYYSVSAERVFIKPAGSYEFRLEGMASSANGGGAVAQIENPTITAMFVPTAYGDVVTSTGVASSR